MVHPVFSVTLVRQQFYAGIISVEEAVSCKLSRIMHYSAVLKNEQKIIRISESASAPKQGL